MLSGGMKVGHYIPSNLLYQQAIQNSKSFHQKNDSKYIVL